MADNTPQQTSQALLQKLRHDSLILSEDWARLSVQERDELQQCADRAVLLNQLVQKKLLTSYQSQRIHKGEMHGLVLGNYRILDRLGSGGMGVVYRAEHRRMRRQVAVKILSVFGEEDPEQTMRFLSEIRAVSQLQHPNIVSAFDAGEVASPDSFLPVLHYYVMELIAGHTLNDLVEKEGRLPPQRACNIICQIASALAKAHQHDLIHRDIKPSNIMVTAEEQAKLLDFGLVRYREQRLTKPGMPLGTLCYMAPEQIQDASSVDARVDIYALGGTLFWCLTGQTPFLAQKSLAQEIIARTSQQAPDVREVSPDIPGDLDAVVAKMMSAHPEQRYSSAQAVQRILLPFLQPRQQTVYSLPKWQAAVGAAGIIPEHLQTGQIHRVLLVDDEPEIRTYCKLVLQSDNIQCDEAGDGLEAIQILKVGNYDLVLMDWEMPHLSGVETFRLLQEKPPCPNLKVVLLSGQMPSDKLAQMMLAGVDDFLTKPFSGVQLQARVKAMLRLKDAQDRSDRFVHFLVASNNDLEDALSSRDSDLVQARNAIVLALAKLAEYRDYETGTHLVRLERYCQKLAEEASRSSVYADQLDDNFLAMFACCAPLHDIGKVGVPDQILRKPGKLTHEERLVMQTHTVIGAETLLAIARQHRFATAMLHFGAQIARSHHERFDGSGYPDRLTSTDIPLAARLVSLADVYDALRSRRPYKAAMSHQESVGIILDASPGHFDPALLPVFRACAPHFERIFSELGD